MSAERDGAESLTLPSVAELAPGLEGVYELVAEQQKEFDARLQRFASEQEILRQRVAALNDASEGGRPATGHRRG